MSNINEQTLIEHLSEFRKRLIITIIFFITIFLISLVFCSDIYKMLTGAFKEKLTVLGPVSRWRGVLLLRRRSHRFCFSYKFRPTALFCDAKYRRLRRLFYETGDCIRYRV